MQASDGLGAGDAQGDVLGGIENINVSAHEDVLIGDGSANMPGGAGADAMDGGAGGDSYFLDNISDPMIENANEGNDTVYASVNYRLGANVEYLVLQAAPSGLRQCSVNGIIGTVRTTCSMAIPAPTPCMAGTATTPISSTTSATR